MKLFLLTLLLASSAFAQSQSPKVTVAPTPTVSVRQGSKSPVEINFRVAPGFHINSNKPTSDLYIPTVVKLDVPTDISVVKLEYPQGELISFPFDPDTKLSVYTGDITVKGTVMALRRSARGTFRVHGNLRYQACDNRACYPPTNVPVSFDVKVTKAASNKPARRNPPQSPHVHS